MAIGISTVIPVQYPAQGGPVSEAQEVFERAFQEANALLASRGIQVVMKQQLPLEPRSAAVDYTRNLLLAIVQEGEERLIDILDLKALDEVSLKSPAFLRDEIVQKVEQHLLAERTPGILISKSGSKFDVRTLAHHTLGIDKEGFLTLNERRLLSGTWKIPAEVLRSYTIIRFVEENGVVVPFDDYDLARANHKGASIDPSKVVHLEEGDEGYYSYERPDWTEEDRRRLDLKFREILIP